MARIVLKLGAWANCNKEAKNVLKAKNECLDEVKRHGDEYIQVGAIRGSTTQARQRKLKQDLLSYGETMRKAKDENRDALAVVEDEGTRNAALKRKDMVSASRERSASMFRKRFCYSGEGEENQTPKRDSFVVPSPFMSMDFGQKSTPLCDQKAREMKSEHLAQALRGSDLQELGNRFLEQKIDGQSLSFLYNQPGRVEAFLQELGVQSIVVNMKFASFLENWATGDFNDVEGEINNL